MPVILAPGRQKQNFEASVGSIARFNLKKRVRECSLVIKHSAVLLYTLNSTLST